MRRPRVRGPRSGWAGLLSVVLVAGLVQVGWLGAPAAAAPEPDRPWQNTKLSPDKRARLLLAKMTLDEKLAMVHGTEGPYVGNVVAIPRLGIPALRLQDGPAGVAGGMTKVTAFPAPITVAASWDPALARRYGAAMGAEVRDKGANVHLAPMINILRVPNGGRNWEAFGEDPHLVGQLADAEIRGIQGQGVVATAKHYAANNQEDDRRQVSAKVDERTLHEIYYPAFKASIKAGAGSVMCAYNRVNGPYACENPETLRALKKEMGFRGWVMSDWGATHSTVSAANAGLDQEMPDSKYFGAALKLAVQTGQVSQARLDDMVFRILRPMFAVGLFDRKDYGNPGMDVRSAAHTRVARDAAAQGTVLLKNQGKVLPISSAARSIAVIGSDARTAPQAVGGGSAGVTPSYVVTPYDGIKELAGAKTKVTYAQGDSAFGAAVPRQYLKTPDGKPGLRAQFYNNKELLGFPVLTRDDPEVDFNWSTASPGPGVNATNWSGRWTGTLTPPTTGSYILQLSSDDGSRLFVDGKQVVDNWGDHGDQTVSARVQLTGGQSHQIEIQYYQSAKRANVSFRWVPPGQLEEAVRTAKEADVAVVFAGLTAREGTDRPTLSLPGDVDQLISAVAAANPHTVVVLNTPGQVLMPWVNEVEAIAAAWLPGQEDGNAIADVLFGAVNPSGKLPMTFAQRPDDYPANSPEQYPGVNHEASYSEGLSVGYRHFDAQDITPLFPFGHGLSYTSFAYRGLSVRPHSVRNGQSVRVSVEVTNTGSRTGSEIVQLYLGYPQAADEPPRALKGFSRVTLAPGKSKRVEITLAPEALTVWDAETHAWTLVPGKYQIMAGSSSRDIRATGSFTVKP